MGRDIISQLPERADERSIYLKFLEESPRGVILTVRLQPRAAKNQFAGTLGDSLKVKVTAAPVEGAANEALCQFLADAFNMAKGRVRIIFGSRSRRKKVLLEGLDKEFIQQRIGELSQDKKE